MHKPDTSQGIPNTYLIEERTFNDKALEEEILFSHNRMEGLSSSSTTESEHSSFCLCESETSNEDLVEAWVSIDHETHPLLATKNGGNGVLGPGYGAAESPIIHDVFKLISELEQECQRLGNQGALERLIFRIRELEDELSKVKEESLALTETLEQRNIEIQRSERKVASKDTIIQNLQHQLRIVKTSGARLRKVDQRASTKAADLDSEAKSNVEIKPNMIRKIEKENTILRQDLETKDNKIAQLQKDAKAAQPLVNIGAAIRRRHIELFLRQLRERGILNDNKGPDREIVEKGNRAAHWCDMRADLALFKCKILSQDKDTGIVQQVYGSTVDRCLKMRNIGPSQFIEAWEMSAMYFASRSFVEGPEGARFEKLFDKIKKLPRSLKNSLEFGIYATFDGCSLAEETLEEMTALTKKFMAQNKRGAGG